MFRGGDVVGSPRGSDTSEGAEKLGISFGADEAARMPRSRRIDTPQPTSILTRFDACSGTAT